MEDYLGIKKAKRKRNLPRNGCGARRKVKADMSLIVGIPGAKKGCLFLGNLQSARDVKELKKRHIKAVLTTCKEAAVDYKLRKAPDIRNKRVEIEDNRNFKILDFLDPCCAWISRELKMGNVLVHCHLGVSRSTSFVLGYLMKYQKMKLDDALKLAKSKRSIISPNRGFLMQLSFYETHHEEPLPKKRESIQRSFYN